MGRMRHRNLGLGYSFRRHKHAMLADGGMDTGICGDQFAFDGAGLGAFPPEYWVPYCGSDYQYITDAGKMAFNSPNMSIIPGAMFKNYMVGDYLWFSAGFTWITRPSVNSYDVALQVTNVSDGKRLFMSHQRDAGAWRYSTTKFTPPSSYTSLATYGDSSAEGALLIWRDGSTMSGYRWDGSTWQYLGGWNFDGTLGKVMDLAIYSGNWGSNAARSVLVHSVRVSHAAMGRRVT